MVRMAIPSRTIRVARRPRAGVPSSRVRDAEIARALSRASKLLAAIRDRSYTTSMKTAVSLPDDVFQAAERHARKTRKSRSRLYAEALAEYLARHGDDAVTDAMNGVVEQLGSCEPDPFVTDAARRVLEASEW